MGLERFEIVPRGTICESQEPTANSKDQHGCHGYTRIGTDLCLRIVNQPAFSSEAQGGGGSNIRGFASGARSGNLRISERSEGLEAPHFRAKRAGGSSAFPSEASGWKPSHLWEGARPLGLAATRLLFFLRALALAKRAMRASINL